MIDFGTVRPGTTLYIPFATYDSNDPSASVTLTGLATTDIEVYKNGSTTQRSSDNGYALLDTDGIDFDAVTGIHGISIDLADNSDAGFYAAGAQYWVVIASITVDAATINFIAATFRIGYPNAILNTTIATLASQTSFTLTAGPAEDDALNGMEIVIHDVASAVQMGRAVISDYTGSTKTVTLAAGTTFTAAASDNVAVIGPSPLQPTVAARTLDVSSGGEAGVDWANVGSATTAVNLSGTNIKTDQKVDVETIKTRAVTCADPVTVLASVGTAATSTAQTGDSYAIVNSGTHGNAALKTLIDTVDTVVDAILVDTAEIGAAGAGLTALPWNAAWDAEVQSEVADALDAAVPGTPTAGSINERIKTMDDADLPTSIAAILDDTGTSGVVIAAASRAGIRKNTALAGFQFLMTDSTNHNPATGLTVTAQRSLDGAALGSCANAVSEISNGLYKIDLAAGDLNGDTVCLRCTATGADDLDITIVTDP